MISTCTLNQSFDAIYIYIFFDRRRKKNWRVDEPWKKGEKRWRFVMQNHWIIFSTIQNCEVTELNLKKSFLKRLILHRIFHHRSIRASLRDSSRWISIEFVLITIPRTSSTRYVGTRGMPRISNVTLPILLFPPFQLAGHYTGPDIQSRRISFRNTIKGRKRESRPTVEPTSSVCIDDPVAAATTTTTTIYACVRVYTRREDGQRSLRCPPLEEGGRREEGGGRGAGPDRVFSTP